MEQVDIIIKDLLKSTGISYSASNFKKLNLRDELGFDSILIVQLAINLSKFYKIDLDDCSIETWKTVNDIYTNLSQVVKTRSR